MISVADFLVISKLADKVSANAFLFFVSLMIVTSIHGFIITLRFRKYNPKHFYGVFDDWKRVLIDKMAIIAA
jgi:hypothetical protein